jgi:cyclohexadieny/prephenate dehydrogenase
MPCFKKIAIIGVGLIGGSIGLALRKRKLAGRVVGFFRHPEKIKQAMRLGCVDAGTHDLQAAVQDADLIILCSPVDDIIAKLRLLKRFISPQTLVTDTGSTKSEILKAGLGLNFIGSHPLTGSEQSGLRFTTPNLLNKSLCVLTPPKGHQKNSLARIARLWHALGARVIVMDSDEHDAALSFTSHLPHAAAYALIGSIPEKYFSLAAGGLRDTTRIAQSNPELWRAIFLSNRRPMLKSLDAYIKSLRICQRAIRRNDKKELLRWLTASQRRRMTAFNR